MQNTIPNCPYSCDSALPVVSFNECNPEINNGQIAKVYAGKLNQCFTDWTNLAQWAARLSQTSTAANAIRTLHVIGSKPKPTGEKKKISLGRTVRGKKSHTLNIKVDETNAVNHEAVREWECGTQISFWYETLDGLLFGGNCGIDGFIDLDMVIPESDGELMTFEGSIDWTAKFTEERIISPLA